MGEALSRGHVEGDTWDVLCVADACMLSAHGFARPYAGLCLVSYAWGHCFCTGAWSEPVSWSVWLTGCLRRCCC